MTSRVSRPLVIYPYTGSRPTRARWALTCSHVLRVFHFRPKQTQHIMCSELIRSRNSQDSVTGDSVTVVGADGVSDATSWWRWSCSRLLMFVHDIVWPSHSVQVQSTIALTELSQIASMTMPYRSARSHAWQNQYVTFSFPFSSLYCLRLSKMSTRYLCRCVDSTVDYVDTKAARPARVNLLLITKSDVNRPPTSR